MPKGKVEVVYLAPSFREGTFFRALSVLRMFSYVTLGCIIVLALKSVRRPRLLQLQWKHFQSSFV